MKIPAALVLGFLVVTIGGCKTAQMKTFDPIPVTASSPEGTRDIILAALSRQHESFSMRAIGPSTADSQRSPALSTIIVFGSDNGEPERTHHFPPGLHRHGRSRRVGWIVAKDEPGALRAVKAGGDWSLAIILTYDAESVTIRYADSINLKYRKDRKGREYIHRRYNGWIARLASDIRKWRLLAGNATPES